MAKKLITVFGATGAQGGSVANIFLNDAKLKSEWDVRAVTRDTTKDAAKKLTSQGAEVVSADMNDKASLAKAMAGADAVFAVTNYWEKLDMNLEIQQGKNLVDAAKEAKVSFFIFSSLPHVKKRSNGALAAVYHFDSKAEIEEYARASDVPSAFFQPGYYMSNIPANMHQTPPDNTWTLAMPVAVDSPIPLFNTADGGKFVKAMVLHRDALIGKRFLAATAYLTPAEILAQFKETFPEAGRSTKFTEVSHDEFRDKVQNGMGMPDFVAEELLENFRLISEFGYYFGESLDETLKYVEDPLTTWVAFMKQTPKFKDLK